MINGSFYTTKELCALVHIIEGRTITRQAVGGLASHHNWGSPAPGLYAAADVTAYLWPRWRRDLARQMGVKVGGPVLHDEWDKDDNCPGCGAFAIWQPPEMRETEPGPGWMCIQGHTNISANAGKD